MRRLVPGYTSLTWAAYLMYTWLFSLRMLPYALDLGNASISPAIEKYCRGFLIVAYLRSECTFISFRRDSKSPPIVVRRMVGGLFPNRKVAGVG